MSEPDGRTIFFGFQEERIGFASLAHRDDGVFISIAILHSKQRLRWCGSWWSDIHIVAHFYLEHAHDTSSHACNVFPTFSISSHIKLLPNQATCQKTVDRSFTLLHSNHPVRPLLPSFQRTRGCLHSCYVYIRYYNFFDHSQESKFKVPQEWHCFSIERLR